MKTEQDGLKESKMEYGLKKGIIYILIISLFISCSNFVNLNDFNEYYEGYDLIKLEYPYAVITWKDDLALENYDVLNLGKYQICYAEHGSGNWKVMNEIGEGEGYEISFSFSNIESGYYDIGIIYIGSDGSESLIHSSTDCYANPNKGWYLFWNG